MLSFIRGLAALALTLLAVTVVSTPGAIADTTVEKTASGLFDFNDCNGQPITGEGTLHLIQVNNGTEFRNTFYGHFTATDPAGNKYVDNIQFSSVTQDSRFVTTFRDVLVSQGSAPNETFLLKIVFEDGTLTFTTEDACHPPVA